MPKIAYNADYGGFSLSREAVELARKLSGNPKWARSLRLLSSIRFNLN